MRSSKSSTKSRRRTKKPDATASLPDDLVVDILSRLPVKSLFRCKGVSRRWRSLIAHPDYRRKFPQIHPSLFYCSSNSGRTIDSVRHVTNVWEGPQRRLVCPSLSFVPGYERMTILDCCNGMLLCRFSESDAHDAFRYVVCDPVKKEMVLLPDSGCGSDELVVRLAGANVFEFYNDEDDCYVEGANIYSPNTGTWTCKEHGWFGNRCVLDGERCVYFNGYLFIATNFFMLSVVHEEGNIWRADTFPLPEDEYEPSDPGFVGILNEHLCYISELEYNKLSIWIREDINKGDWVMKHQVSLEVLCGKQIGRYRSNSWYVVGILQDKDCNFVLYVAGRTLMAYDVDNEEIHAIQRLERGCFPPYFLYVPSCPEELATG